MKFFFTWRRFLILILTTLTFSSCKKKSEYISVTEAEKAVFVSTHLIPDNHFLGDQVCKECHVNEFKDWEGSHHDKAMEIAKESTMLGDFNDAKFTSQGITSHFYRKGADFYVNTEGPDGGYHDYKIVYTFGIEPLQQYIVKFPDGHYQCLRTAWDTEKGMWFDLYPNFKVVHSEWLHWSRGGLNWNMMCSDCHSTNVRKNYDYKTHSYDTKYAIINVSCEACHGPGKEHVEQANKLGDNYKFANDLKMATTRDPKGLVDDCARCHMRREMVSEHYNFEGSMLDHYFPQLIVNNTYFPDGQILDEDYVYGSFIQSKMYHNNVTCTDCHNPHSTKLKIEGNALCIQCHISEDYDTPKHHFHPMDTESSQCINCHMTGRYYMGNDYRRDHSFRIPRPDLSIKYDTPNACTQCHTDKTDEWALENFKEQYGEPKKNHFSDLLASGLMGSEHGLDDLFKLAHDTSYPDIARASAVEGISNYINSFAIDDMLKFLKDESTLVKAATLDALGTMQTTDYLNYFLPLLKDDKRTVRIKAFFALGALDEKQIPKEYIEFYNKVKTEYDTSIRVNLDFVGGRIRNADYKLKKGDLKGAIKGYESALEIDVLNNIVRTNLANLYYRNNEFDKAEAAFKTIIKQEANYGETYYSYALLLAELNRTDDAIKQLTLAIKFMPENTRSYYNLSLLYDKKGDFKKAEDAAVRGLKIAPQNESLLYILAYLYNKNNQKEKAKNIAKRLVELYPNNPDYKTLKNQISVR